MRVIARSCSSCVAAALTWSMVLAGASTALAATCVGDCDGDGRVTAPELALVRRIIRGKAALSACESVDANGNGVVADDEVRTAVRNAWLGCPRTPPTPSPTATVSPTPGSGAAPALRLRLRNPGSSMVIAAVSGVRLGGASVGSPTYGPVTRSVAPGVLDLALDVAPGEWLHHVSASSTGQQQDLRTLVVADPSAPAMVEWTLFTTVLAVNRSGDDGDGVCDASCTLRDAVTTAASAAPPVLIRFDHAAFPGGVARVVVTQNAALQLRSAGTVMDGTDAEGNPSPLADFSARIYPSVITLAPVNPPPTADDCPCMLSPGAALQVVAAGVRLTGLSVERQLPPPGQICCGDQDLVVFGGGSKNSSIATTRLDGGAAAITSAEVPQGMLGPATGKDCVDAEGTGATAQEPVRVENSELRFCFDRGAKSKQGLLELHHDWIHNNLRGGMFAQSPAAGVEQAGVVVATDTLSEQNGRNCPTGNFAACGDQMVTRNEASELSAQGPFTEIACTGSVLRDGVQQGIFFQDRSTGSVRDSYVCGINNGAGGKGVLVQKRTGSAADIVMRGTAVVYNDDAGVKFKHTIGADLGTNGSTGAGNNAFTENGGFIRRNVVNAMDAPIAVVHAQGNQWQHCYAPGNSDPDRCDVRRISDSDTNNSPVVFPAFDKVDVDDPEPQQGTDAVRIDAVSPAVAVEGGVVRITGSGFDAISGHAGGVSGDCRALRSGNRCQPLNGTCVEFLVDGVWTEAREVLAVTPTTVVVRSPLTCAAPTQVRVRRRVLDDGEAVSPPAAFCHN